MKSDRLLSILLLLRTRGLVPATELAARLDVSVRTIYRDVEALSASGVPVHAERGRYGGIALLPGYRTDVTGLTADESRALFVLTARGTHAALGLDDALGSALSKVIAALPEPHSRAAELTSRRILVDPERWTRETHQPSGIDELGMAVFTDRRVRLSYRHGGATTTSDYTVDPYGLVVTAGVWYLVADRAGEPRLFRADRVRAAEVTDEPVRRRESVELSDVWEVLRRDVEERPAAVRVEARVRLSRLEMFRRTEAARLTAEPVVDAAGEWAGVRLAYPEIGAVRSLLAFGEHVEVLSPPEARERMAEAAAALMKLYGDGGSAPP